MTGRFVLGRRYSNYAHAVAFAAQPCAQVDHQLEFGSTLSLTGPQDFQTCTARVAAELRMHVTFEQPEHAPRRTPQRDLWGEFLQWRSAYRESVRRAWDAQTQQEKARRVAIKSTFHDARSAFAGRPDLSLTERREQLSAARVTRLEAEAALRERVHRERAALKGAARRPISDQYRDFLQERVQSGDERALRELRRMQQMRVRTGLAVGADDGRSICFSAPSRGAADSSTADHNEILYRGPSITYEVLATGEVNYRKDGAAFLVDEGRTLRLWDSERVAIEIALRLAQLEGIRQVRLAELEAQAQERQTAQREREAWERNVLRDIVLNPQPPADDGARSPEQDEGPPADPGAPDSGPDIER
jgi:hypothetical protein